MGCGKSRYPSPDGSETDVRNANAKTKKNSNATSSLQATASKKKSNGSSTGDKKSKEKKGKEAGKSSPYRKPNERSGSLNKGKELGSPKVKVTGDKANGATTYKTVTLEVPTEMAKLDVPSRTTKDFKSITSNKIVRVTNSQIEFFRMLDDKIEQGAENLTSGEVSEVSSIDETAEYDGIMRMSPKLESKLQENAN